MLLTGQVSSAELRQLSIDTAAKVGKVRRVHNELTIEGAISLVARTNDTWLTSKVKSKMLANSKIKGNSIKVVTENGVVFLMGIISKEEADRATEAANSTTRRQTQGRN